MVKDIKVLGEEEDCPDYRVLLHSEGADTFGERVVLLGGCTAR